MQARCLLLVPCGGPCWSSSVFLVGAEAEEAAFLRRLWTKTMLWFSHTSWNQAHPLRLRRSARAVPEAQQPSRDAREFSHRSRTSSTSRRAVQQYARSTGLRLVSSSPCLTLVIFLEPLSRLPLPVFLLPCLCTPHIAARRLLQHPRQSLYQCEPQSGCALASAFKAALSPAPHRTARRICLVFLCMFSV